MTPADLTEKMDTLWTTTWPHYVPKMADAVFRKRNPFFWWLSEKGHVVYISEGRDIRFPLEVDINPTVTEIGKTGTVSLTDVDPLTTVIYPWAVIAGNINRYRQDDATNRGKAQVIPLMNVKRKNLDKSIRRKFETVLFRAEDTRPVGGYNSLLDLVDDTPTVSKTVGGYNQSGNSWWQNQARTASGVAALTLRKDLQQTLYDLEDVEEAGDLILMGRDAYGTYEDDLLEMKMIINKGLADASFAHLVYRGIPMLKAPNCPASRLFMLNSDYIYLILHKAFNFAMTPWKEVINQPFNRSAQVVVMGQFICSNRRAQATILGLNF